MTNPIAADAPRPMQDSPEAEESSVSRGKTIPFTLQEELFLFCSLMLVTCCFLPCRVTDRELTPWGLMSSSFPSAISIGLMTLFILWWITPLSVCLPRVRPWFGIATALSVNMAVAGLPVLSGRADYGATLAQLFALGLLVLSANPAIVKAGDLVMHRLNSRKAEVFHHWVATVLGIHFSAQELYAKVETEVRARQWPGVQFMRVLHTEAGILSHKREYLRVVRQRQVFDLCAASFGKDYFFSVREAEIKAQLTLATLIIFVLALFLVFSLCPCTSARQPLYLGS